MTIEFRKFIGKNMPMIKLSSVRPQKPANKNLFYEGPDIAKMTLCT